MAAQFLQSHDTPFRVAEENANLPTVQTNIGSASGDGRVRLPDRSFLAEPAILIVDYLRLFLGEIDGALTRKGRAFYRYADTITRGRVRSEAHVRDLEALTLVHLQQIFTARAAIGDPRARGKYYLLADYHNDAVPCYFKKPPPEAFIGTSSLTGST